MLKALFGWATPIVRRPRYPLIYTRFALKEGAWHTWEFRLVITSRRLEFGFRLRSLPLLCILTHLLTGCLVTRRPVARVLKGVSYSVWLQSLLPDI